MDMFKCKMIDEARGTNRGNKLWLELIKNTLVIVVITLLVQIITSVVILCLGVNDNETLTNVLFLWGQILGIAFILLYCCLIEKRPVSSVGFRKGNIVKQYLTGLGTGFALFGSVIIVGTSLGAFRFAGFGKNIDPLMLILFLGGFLIQGMSEEVQCRSYFMVSVARKSSVWIAIVANALVFTLLHSLNTGFGIIPIVNLMLFSVYLSLYMLKTDNIWGISAIHSIWNFAQGCIYGLSVSGIEHMPTVFVFESTDNHLMNGGSFGPEGGLVVTGVFATAILVTVFAIQADQNLVLPKSRPQNPL